MDPLLIARCSEDRIHLAVCQVALVEGKTPPEWIELVPAGPEVNAFDGRKFRNANPQAVVERFKAHPMDIPIDYEHSSELKGPRGEEAPAIGWITDLEVRAGSIWGKVQWNERGAKSLTSREYRYVSPAFTHDKTGNIIALVSAGLTNRPALHLAALASREDHDAARKSEKEKSLNPKILKMLGLAEGATPEQIDAAVAAHEAKNAELVSQASAAKAEVTAAKAEVATARTELAKAQQPDLGKFVPRADFEAALARADKAEKVNAEATATAHRKDAEAAIDAALKAGKIVPAGKDFYVGVCSTPAGLEEFKKFTGVQPAIGGDATAPVVKDGPPANGGTEPQLTAEEIAVARNCGVDPTMVLNQKRVAAGLAPIALASTGSKPTGTGLGK